MSQLDDLVYQYCVVECTKTVEKCPIADKYDGFFCPRCGGVIAKMGAKTLKDGSTEQYTKDYTGGIIEVITETIHLLGFACSCKLGDLRRNEQHLKRYNFSETDNRCWRARSIERITKKSAYLKTQNRPKVANFSEAVDKLKQMFNGEEM